MQEKAVPVEIHPQALTGEAREKRIKEYLAAHLACEEPKRVAPLSARERLNGDVRPLPPEEEIREPTEEEKLVALENHMKMLLTARTKMFREKYPDGTVKELKNYLKRFKDI